MKKLLSFILVLVMIMSMSAAVFAEESTGETYEDMSTVTIEKEYQATNENTTSPAETFQFTINGTSVTDAADGVTVANMPVPTIGEVSYAAGEAGSETAKKDITVTLPEYTSVGIYTYTITETAGTTAGVTYYDEEITLVVTVIQDKEGKIRVAAVHTEEEGAAKSDAFANVYAAGSLTVSKNVTGLFGDQSKDFTVTVTFTAPEGMTVKEAISYTDGTEDKTIATTDWVDGVATAVITLKHKESVTFTNIPYGVTYEVTEADYTAEENGGYDEADYTFGEDKTINSSEETVTITNNKGGSVDTGIVLDSMPYILILAMVCGGAILFFVNKRRSMNF